MLRASLQRPFQSGRRQWGGQKTPSGSDAEKSDEPSRSRRKIRACMELALSKLDAAGRELLLLYYVEQLTVPEIA